MMMMIIIFNALVNRMTCPLVPFGVFSPLDISYEDMPWFGPLFIKIKLNQPRRTRRFILRRNRHPIFFSTRTQAWELGGLGIIAVFICNECI